MPCKVCVFTYSLVAYRVVVAILDAFHFDLSSARPLDKEEERGSKHRGLLLGGGPRKGKGALGPSVPATASATETPKGEGL